MDNIVELLMAMARRSGISATVGEPGEMSKINYKRKDFYTVEQLIKNGTIPEYYAQFVPRTCICGQPVIANTNLTQIMCSNPRCISNIASSVEKYCKHYKIRGIGPKKAYQLVKDHGCKSILDFFSIPLPEIAADVQESLKQPVSYAQAVQLLYIPDLSTRALTVFDRIDSYGQYRELRDRYSLPIGFFIERVGGEGTLAMQVMQLLDAYDWELQNLHNFFKIQKSAKVTLYVAMTGEVNLQLPEVGLGKMTKDCFLQILNSLYPDYITFSMTSSVNKANFVVAEYPSGTRKYVLASQEFPEKLTTSRNLLLMALNIEAFFRGVFGEELGEVYGKALMARSEFYRTVSENGTAKVTETVGADFKEEQKV